ncbi:carboxylate-amine ligase [Actinoplanes utahensis]|uniref:carboxylate-amine ligase n=1 Tax=Actinoplanes utahensis TaxID=1869 RepID=UPI000AE67D05|nr:glutamate--cysteine ligase [Actinoplanes utahensis]GIF31585.1 putative glutamate--cysteine ligase 2 [Actinoplanes utahensis]
MRAALVAARAVDTARLTVGVEEEFLLLDPATMENRPAAPAVLAALPADVQHLSRREFRHSMIEMVTPVCTGLDEVGSHLRLLRTAAARSARSAGAMLAAVGATPVGEPERAVTDDPRFRAIADHYGPVVDDPAVCGCHVHVGVPDRELAVQVCNHLRPWLPVLQALTVNSPFHDGRDTGHASWRAMQLDRWPTLGPTPWFASAEDLDRTVELLVASGAMLDASLILWHARPSAGYPTVEIRVADTCPTTGDAVLLAGLARALVATAVDRIGAGHAAPQIPGHLVRAAHWNAAHAGLGGTLLDLRQGRARPAWDLVGDLMHTVTPALSRSGDLPLIEAELTRLRTEGPGATRQRDAFARSGDLRTALALTGVPDGSLIDR